MAKKDFQTVQEWEKFEADKNELLLKAKAEIEALNNRREGILARIGEDDKTAAGELEKDDATKARLKTEVEVLEALLKTIPARKDYARGVEIEKIIPVAEKIAAEMQPFVDEINQKVAALNATNKKLLDYLGKFSELGETKSLSLKSEFCDYGLNELRSFNNMGTGVPGARNSVDLNFVLMAATYEKDELTAWIDHARAAVEKRMEKMRRHARWLKDKSMPEPEWAHCPKCYENVTSQQRGGQYHCQNCNKLFEAENVPGALERKTDPKKTIEET